MSKPNLLAIWAKHEHGEGATNEELGHLIERFESLQDGLELAEQITDACRKICEQHAELRKQAEAAVARVRALCMSTDGEPLESDFDGNTVGDIRRALDGEQS